MPAKPSKPKTTPKPAPKAPKPTKPAKGEVGSHVTMILDRSGSMSSIASDVAGAVNAFIAEQQKVDDNGTFTLVQFDDQDPFEIIRDGPFATCAPLAIYQPRGSTPLYDAIGKGIAHLSSRILVGSAPKKIIFVIQTDGLENSSREYTAQTIGDLISAKQKEGWQFLFLGANQNAILTGAALNIAARSSLSNVHTGGGYRSSMHATGQNVASFKADISLSAVPDYTPAQRAAAMQPGEPS